MYTDAGVEGKSDGVLDAAVTEVNTPTSLGSNSAVPIDTRQKLEQLSNLPNEILSGVFSWCCPTFYDPFRAPPMSALVLSHVCRQWRKITFSTPNLWTYAILGAPRHNCESMTELMLLWIANSKSCPVAIDIDFTQFAAFKKPDAILPTVLELAMLASAKKGPQVPDEVPLVVSVQPSISIPFPYVSEVYYWTNEGYERQEQFSPNSVQLRVSTRPCLLLGMDGHRNFGPYLVHLDLRDEEKSICLTMEEALDIIRVFRNLRHLSLRLGYSGSEGDPCTLPHLKTLALSWLDEADPSPILNALSAPSLQNLELDGNIPVALAVGTEWNSLRRLIVRSIPPLRTLDLHKIRCADVDLLGCLGRCTSLKRLWLQDCSVDERLVNDLIEASHPLVEAIQTALQNLRTLGLVRCDIFNAQHFFQSLVVSGLVWRVSNLDGLYISGCNVHDDVSTWHLLRSRYEDGSYQCPVSSLAVKEMEIHELTFDGSRTYHVSEL